MMNKIDFAFLNLFQKRYFEGQLDSWLTNSPENEKKHNMTCRITSFSFRFQVKLTVQGEVQNSSTILQQTFVVEYIVNGQMCDECRRVEAKDTWNASVSPILQFKLVLLSNKIHNRKFLILFFGGFRWRLLLSGTCLTICLLYNT